MDLLIDKSGKPEDLQIGQRISYKSYFEKFISTIGDFSGTLSPLFKELGEGGFKASASSSLPLLALGT